MVTRCACACHAGSIAERQPWYVGIDVRDPIGAATACGNCINNHVAALLDEPPSRPVSPPLTPWTPDDDAN